MDNSLVLNNERNSPILDLHGVPLRAPHVRVAWAKAILLSVVLSRTSKVTMIGESAPKSWGFDVEYPDKGFGILRLVPLSEGQAGLRLRLFEEPVDSKQDYEQDYAQSR